MGMNERSVYDFQSGFARGMFRFLLMLMVILTGMVAWDTVHLLVSWLSGDFSWLRMAEHGLFGLLVAEGWFVFWLLVREHPERSGANWWGFRYGCREENVVSRTLDDPVAGNVAMVLGYLWLGGVLAVLFPVMFGFTPFGMDMKMATSLLVQSIPVFMLVVMTTSGVLFRLRRKRLPVERTPDSGCVRGI